MAMERSKRDLEALVSSQKEQLARYEKRLKDVVAAYKGLLKEKEALEISLSVAAKPGADQEKENGNETSVNITSEPKDNESQLQTQILTLMNSLATLSAEKSRMEASFQSDKKQLRAQLAQKDQTITELEAKIKETTERAKASVDEVKAKWIIERQEREKESNNQIIMIRELQKLYADERHLKENIEMQLNNFKTQFSCNETESSRLRELQSELKEAKAMIKQLENRNKQGQAPHVDSVTILRQVQDEMQRLKDQHAIAIKLEQQRVIQAEETSKNQAALHENRVANLEERLAELSCTVGRYDRLRQEDQESIQALKKKLHELRLFTDVSNGRNEQRRQSFNKSNQDIGAIVEEIMRLKKLLLQENTRSSNPIDISKIFTVGTDHTECQAELKRAEKNYEDAKLEITKLQDRLEMQKSHLWTLQEKVKILNRNIDEEELELKQQNERQRQAIKEERTKWKNAITELENEHRCRVNELEQQLQKQRQRSLQLLEEKEQEIKTLKTSFDLFHTVTVLPTAELTNTECCTASSDADESVDSNTGNVSTKTTNIRPKKLSLSAGGDNCHMLHYANEIARKEIEIAAIRKTKNAAESMLRRAIQDKVELCDKINELEEEVDRLERCKTREGANLEYLKNVIISFISTKDAEGKRHMMNAISAVLQFTPTEIQTINAAFLKK